MMFALVTCIESIQYVLVVAFATKGRLERQREIVLLARVCQFVRLKHAMAFTVTDSPRFQLHEIAR